MGNLSPMMMQYMRIKEEHQECMLFFRLGDFYELFFEDAVLASEVLDLTLTGRDCGLDERAPMCGVPHHAANIYINKLIKKGYKVAICEQTSLPKKGVKLVDREVVRIVTPGTVVEDTLLNDDTNNYIVSLFLEDKDIGMAFADVSTGEFFISSIDSEDRFSVIFNELTRLNSSEILVNEKMNDYISESSDFSRLKGISYDISINDYYNLDFAKAILNKHFGKSNINISKYKDVLVCAAGSLLRYLSATQMNSLEQINKMLMYDFSKYMSIDTFTRNSLEIGKTIRKNKKQGSLLWVIDKTSTSLGSRKTRQWLEMPLINKTKIEERLNAVEYFLNNMNTSSHLQETLKHVKDIERLSTKVTYSNISPRECIALRDSIKVIPIIKSTIDDTGIVLINECNDKLESLDDVYELLKSSIMDEPAVSVKDGGVIKRGYDQELDRLYQLIDKGSELISDMEEAERRETGIKNLKIKYNRVFGYFIEVTKSNLQMVPYRYKRKQTLANCERYITDDLKVLEEDIESAKEKISKIELDIFNEVKYALKKQIKRMQLSAEQIAIIDTLVSFAKVAGENHYVKPIINEEGVLDIKNGRHPVVELSSNVSGFVPNDINMNNDSDRLIVITGPNMSGKSTYLRQSALITLMAHMGCYVPASFANICITDKIFSRVGASDDLYLGQSTFMVEMTELAYILKNATKDSLIILDEIGRGTSTFDGLSIAWSTIEHISDSSILGTKTIFATHYHQLSQLEGLVDGVKNYSVSVKEYNKNVIFMRKIVRGSTDKSFGLHVAKIAGVPQSVIDRGEEVLKILEENEISEITPINQNDEMIKTSDSHNEITEIQEILDEIREMDTSITTPIEALIMIQKLKDELK